MCRKMHSIYGQACHNYAFATSKNRAYRCELQELNLSRVNLTGTFTVGTSKYVEYGLGNSNMRPEGYSEITR
jgi:hypothetical protein